MEFIKKNQHIFRLYISPEFFSEEREICFLRLSQIIEIERKIRFSKSKDI